MAVVDLLDGACLASGGAAARRRRRRGAAGAALLAAVTGAAASLRSPLQALTPPLSAPAALSSCPSPVRRPAASSHAPATTSALLAAGVGAVFAGFAGLPARSKVARQAGGGVYKPSQQFSFRYDQRTGRVSFTSDGVLDVRLGTVAKGAPARYLAVPDRIVKAAWPADTMAPVRIEGPGRYVLPLPHLELLALRWQAKVALRASYYEDARTLRIFSEGVDLGLSGLGPGDAAFRNAFDMAVRGRVVDTSEGNIGELHLEVHMDIRGKVPGPLAMITPEPALRDAAAEVSKLTIGFVMETVAGRVADDYAVWEAAEYGTGVMAASPRAATAVS